MTFAHHDPKVLQLISSAIKDAHLFDPDAGFGSTWDRSQLSGEEATHYAKAVLNSLHAADWKSRRPNRFVKRFG
jgi:hypothetical protein